jgi:cytoskeletal protein CcmA (bactofilin family)
MKLPDQAAAQAAVTNSLTANGFAGLNPNINFNQDAVRNPTGYPEINISATKNVPTDLLGVLSASLKSVTLSVTAEAVSPVQSLQPPFTYLLFANQDLSMNGSQHTQGSIHSNHNVEVKGSQVLGGNVEGATGVKMIGSEHVTGYVQADTLENIKVIGSEKIDGGKKAGATNIAMPDFTQQIIDATEDADKYLSGQPKAPYWDGTNFTFNGTNVHGGTIYVQGNVTINGSCSWTGTILATGDITISGSSQITGSNQMFLYSKNGNITANGSCSFGNGTSNCIAYAPNGSITVNGSSDWYGRLIANTLNISGSENFYGTNVNNNLALPYGVSTGSTRPQIIL